MPELTIDLLVNHIIEITVCEALSDLVGCHHTIAVQIKNTMSGPKILFIDQTSLVRGTGQELGIADLSVTICIESAEQLPPVHVFTHRRFELVLDKTHGVLNLFH